MVSTPEILIHVYDLILTNQDISTKIDMQEMYVEAVSQVGTNMLECQPEMILSDITIFFITIFRSVKQLRQNFTQAVPIKGDF